VGDVHEHNVVMAFSLAGMYGINFATMVASPKIALGLISKLSEALQH
jgi:hypothetical protein